MLIMVANLYLRTIMKHEDFKVKSFEFDPGESLKRDMDEPATDEQKKLIIEICMERQIPIDPNGPWPNPFTKWDAGQMIDTLKGKVKPLSGPKCQHCGNPMESAKTKFSPSDEKNFATCKTPDCQANMVKTRIIVD